MSTERYFELLNEFNETGLPFNGTHDLMNYVNDAHPDEIDAFMNKYNELEEQS